MRISHINLNEFSLFQNLDLSFSPGLNVLIGANGTGKSHLMKLLYSVLKSVEARSSPGRPRDHSSRLHEKLAGVFKPDKDEIGRLVRRARGRKKSTATIKLGDFKARMTLTTLGNLQLSCSGEPPQAPCVFLPSREALALYDGFIHAYNERELSIDETYYDLCLALSARPLRGPRKADQATLIGPLEEIIGGRVVLEGHRFHVHSSDGLIEAHLLAEGFRKIAGLVHLIANGSLTRNGILFWDEPEANLNPVLITKVAKLLRDLAHRGLQVFLATHDYLLSHELSLAAEYQSEPRVDMRFFALSRRQASTVTAESGQSLAELDHNPILDEFAAHYDREHDLFRMRESGQTGRTP